MSPHPLPSAGETPLLGQLQGPGSRGASPLHTLAVTIQKGPTLRDGPQVRCQVTSNHNLPTLGWPGEVVSHRDATGWALTYCTLLVSVYQPRFSREKVTYDKDMCHFQPVTQHHPGTLSI